MITYGEFASQYTYLDVYRYVITVRDFFLAVLKFHMNSTPPSS